ncbi:hypothetical protein G6F22_021412 [Rhizopus arrhizus]|nr:hypothetical protein G6F22_021412 [Rhizopus arrhizus]
MLQALRRGHQLRGRAVKALGGALQATLLAARHGLGGLHDAAQQFGTRHAGQFGGGGRRRRAHVGHEIHDGEVGFVPDAADHGDLAGGHLARQVFVVGAPEMFDAAPPAHQPEIGSAPD